MARRYSHPVTKKVTRALRALFNATHPSAEVVFDLKYALLIVTQVLNDVRGDDTQIKLHYVEQLARRVDPAGQGHECLRVKAVDTFLNIIMESTWVPSEWDSDPHQPDNIVAGIWRGMQRVWVELSQAHELLKRRGDDLVAFEVEEDRVRDGMWENDLHVMAMHGEDMLEFEGPGPTRPPNQFYQLGEPHVATDFLGPWSEDEQLTLMTVYRSHPDKTPWHQAAIHSHTYWPNGPFCRRWEDARDMFNELTEKGFEMTDSVMEAHIEETPHYRQNDDDLDMDSS